MACISVPTAVMMAGMAASAAGSYMTQQDNNRNTNRQIRARNDAAMQGVAQQTADQAKSSDILNSTMAGFQAPQQQAALDANVASRAATINNNSVTPASIVDPSVNANAPKVVQDDLASKMAAASAYSKQQGDALARVGATGDTMGGNNINLAASQSKIGQESNFAKGDYAVNQAQQRTAYANARRAASPWGSILQLLGSAASMYGAGASGAAGAAASDAGAANADSWGAASGLVNGSQSASGAPFIASGNYYGAGV